MPVGQFTDGGIFSFGVPANVLAALADGSAVLSISQGTGIIGFLDSLNLQLQTSAAVAPVPEPATLLLLGTGLGGVVGAARRRRKQK